MKDSKLNNLLSIDNFSEKEVFKNAKATKRTEVAKDILERKEESGENVSEKSKTKEEHSYGKLNNLCDLENFTEKDFFKSYGPTKRTDVAKDILKEFKNIKADDDEDDDKYEKKGKVVKKLKDDDKKDKDDKKKPMSKSKKEDEDEDDKDGKKELSAAQKKLPESLQKVMLKRMNK